MSDEHNILDYECDDQGEALLDQSGDLEEPMELGEAESEENQSEDSGHLLTCGNRDIFEEDDHLDASQLMEDVNAPTPEDPAVPARSAETEEALQPVPIPDWSEEIEGRDSTNLEHCSVEQDFGTCGPQFLSYSC